jgi:hypothetical protein
MRRLLLVAVGVFGLLGVGGAHLFTPPRAGGKAPAPPDPPPFSGKLIAVITKDGLVGAGYTLEKATVRQLGGRAFVVGRVAKDPPRKLTPPDVPGTTVWVPVDAITHIIEMEQRKPNK